VVQVEREGHAYLAPGVLAAVCDQELCLVAAQILLVVDFGEGEDDRTAGAQLPGDLPGGILANEACQDS
jgi:hypothetical protein